MILEANLKKDLFAVNRDRVKKKNKIRQRVLSEIFIGIAD